MRRLFLGSLLSLGLLADGPALIGGETPSSPESPSSKPDPVALVHQLGHRSFKERMTAALKLEEMGKKAVPALEDGLKASQLEVRRRCEDLLHLANRTDTEVALALFMGNKDTSRLLKLPSWDRFSKLAGDDDKAKKLFVDMFCAEGPLLTEMETNKNFATRFQAHCQDLQRNMYTPQGQANPIPHPSIVALLFLASDARLSTDLQSFYTLTNFFHQPNIQQGFRTDPASRKVLVGWLEKNGGDQNKLSQTFHIARQMELKEAVPMALKMVNEKSSQAYMRGTALLFLGSVGGKEHMKDVLPLLEDATNMGQLRTGTITVNTQMRDVALAALIQLSGQSLNDYDFAYLKQFRAYNKTYNLPPSYFGFADDTARAAAIKKWKDSQAADEKKEEKKDKK